MADSNVLESLSPSRLLTNSTDFRYKLETRNLYSIDVQYPITETNTANKIVNAIGSITGAITPFKSFNLQNTVVGRLVTNTTPLTEIGLIMLSKQMLLNSMSHLAQQTFPSINVGNFLQGGKLFRKNVDFSITKKENEGFLQKFLDNIAYHYTNKDNPFTKNNNTINIYVQNTGYGQLSLLYDALNKNVYKSSNPTLIDYGNTVGNPLVSASVVNERNNKIYFSFDNKITNPYLGYYSKDNSAVNNTMLNSLDFLPTDVKEYAPNSDYIKTYFGTTNKTKPETDVLNWVDLNTDTEFSNDVLTNKLVWGRDGVSFTAEQRIAQLRGNTTEEKINSPEQYIGNFNIQTGLLEYTRNLLNASEGNRVDITRKVFKEGNNIVGYNGSPLFEAPQTKYAGNSGIARVKGVRQHSILDPYDKFAKAIRFNGNQIYGGNQNSVIYKTVMPRIHPTLSKDDKIVDPKNLMFSIENLAIRAFSNGSYGIIDDELASQIPLAEVGPFNGRIMWFPPYAIEVNETAEAKYESTVMVGRSEPMYNYMSSERSATLNFMLLIDYPPQLVNYVGPNKQKAISEFFAFGGDPVVDSYTNMLNIQKKIDDLQASIIPEQTMCFEPNVISPNAYTIFFPNDMPNESQVNTIMDDMYKNYTYEIKSGLASSAVNDQTSNGLNEDIFILSGVTKVDGYTYAIDKGAISGFSQYDTDADCPLNRTLKEIFSDENNINLYDINIVGHSSKLYYGSNEQTYNTTLGERRAEAAAEFIRRRLKALFNGRTLNVNINTFSTGSEGANPSTSTASSIPTVEAHQERRAIITIVRNNNPSSVINNQLSQDEKTKNIETRKQIDSLTTQLNRLKSLAYNGIFTERTKTGENGVGDTGILTGFKAVSGNYYYPAFHSQTPEDFHKRLTFLQQCTRQGASKRYTAEVDAAGIYRSRNSVFGRQPICILRVGDFFYTKVIINNVTIDYRETIWDNNPEGFGSQPMIARVTLQMKLIGGQSLSGPIDALQNAVSFNYYANSNFTNQGMYLTPSKAAIDQEKYINGVLAAEKSMLENKYNEFINRPAK